MYRWLGALVFSVSLLTITGLEEASAGGRGVCGNDIVEPGEQCDNAEFNGRMCTDLGFSGGTLACDQNCQFDTSGCTGTGAMCGDGVVEGSESCDGNDLNGFTCITLGFQSGTLSCTSSCTFDTSQCGVFGPFCGNDRAEGEEQCDGIDLAGRSCSSFGFTAGTLACNRNCTVDTSGCNNNGPTASLWIIKETSGGDATFNFTSPQLGDFEITTTNGTGSAHFENIDLGDYGLGELGPDAPWILTGSSCDNGDNPDAIVLEEGDMVTCTFNNEIPTQPQVGGEFLPIESTVLLLAVAQTFSWMIPVILAGIGIGFVLVRRIR